MYTAKTVGSCVSMSCSRIFNSFEKTKQIVVVVVVVSHNEILNTLGEEESCGARFEFQKFKNMKEEKTKQPHKSHTTHEKHPQ